MGQAILWIEPVSRTLQTAAVSTCTGTEIDLKGRYATAVAQVDSTAGVVTFQGTVDGDNWTNLACVNLATGKAKATSTAGGIYSISVLGINQFRASITTASTAGISVEANILPVSNSLHATT